MAAAPLPTLRFDMLDRQQQQPSSSPVGTSTQSPLEQLGRLNRLGKKPEGVKFTRQPSAVTSIPQLTEAFNSRNSIISFQSSIFSEKDYGETSPEFFGKFQKPFGSGDAEDEVLESSSSWKVVEVEDDETVDGHTQVSAAGATTVPLGGSVLVVDEEEDEEFEKFRHSQQVLKQHLSPNQFTTSTRLSKFLDLNSGHHEMSFPLVASPATSPLRQDFDQSGEGSGRSSTDTIRGDSSNLVDLPARLQSLVLDKSSSVSVPIQLHLSPITSSNIVSASEIQPDHGFDGSEWGQSVDGVTSKLPPVVLEISQQRQHAQRRQQSQPKHPESMKTTKEIDRIQNLTKLPTRSASLRRNLTKPATGSTPTSPSQSSPISVAIESNAKESKYNGMEETKILFQQPPVRQRPRANTQDASERVGVLLPSANLHNSDSNNNQQQHFSTSGKVKSHKTPHVILPQRPAPAPPFQSTAVHYLNDNITSVSSTSIKGTPPDQFIASVKSLKKGKLPVLPPQTFHSTTGTTVTLTSTSSTTSPPQQPTSTFSVTSRQVYVPHQVHPGHPPRSSSSPATPQRQAEGSGSGGIAGVGRKHIHMTPSPLIPPNQQQLRPSIPQPQTYQPLQNSPKGAIKRNNPPAPLHPPSRSDPTRISDTYSFYQLDSPANSPGHTPSPTSTIIPKGMYMKVPVESTNSSPSGSPQPSLHTQPQKHSGRVDHFVPPSTPQEFLQLGIKHHSTSRSNKDLSLAAFYFERAATLNGGCPGGYLFWGLTLRSGWGVVKDEKKGFLWLRRACEGSIGVPASSQQNAAELRPELSFAVFEVAQSLLNGWGVPKDMKMAMEYLMVAAKLNDIDAMFALASCYLNMKSSNKKEAAKWYRKAVDLGADKSGLAWIYKKKYTSI